MSWQLNGDGRDRRGIVRKAISKVFLWLLSVLALLFCAGSVIAVLVWLSKQLWTVFVAEFLNQL